MSHRYNSRANQLKKMDRIEQEKCELHEEVTTLRENYERLTGMMETMVTAQNQPPPPHHTPLQRTVISEVVFTPIYKALQHHMPPGFP